MTLNIFSINNIWSRSKQPYGKIGEIECIDTNNDSTPSSNPFAIRTNDLYIGTSDGFVHKFRLRMKIINEANQPDSKGYECLCIGNQNLGTRKAIVKIQVVTVSLHRVFTLSDNLIQILDSDNLQVIPNIKLKNVLAFAISNTSDQHQGGYVEICVSTKRSKVQIYRLDKVNLNLMSEISVQDLIISLAMDERGIIACSEREYFAYDSSNNQDRRSTGSFNSIFKLDDLNTPTCFTDISPGEYLLNGPNVGVTTSLQGMSQRAPIMFVSPPVDFLYSHPYLVVLVRDYVQIYSYLDDQLKQEIPLKQCRTLTNIQQANLKQVIITNKDNIYILEPLSLEEQIEQLLITFRLQEALTLAESHCSSVKQRRTNPLVISTKKRIAFIEFGAMNVVRALSLFEDIHIDFHEIMAQIPNLVPLNSSWSTIDETNQNQYVQWLNALVDYMTKQSIDFSRQIDYYPALLKAYLITKPPETILEFVETNASYIPVDYHHILLDAHLSHAAAILCSTHEKHEQAIEIWKKLVSKAYPHDETFPGTWIIAKYVLDRNIDRALEFSTAKWLLQQQEEDLALKIFTSKHQKESNTDPFCSNRVIDSIKMHATALITYLEYAVFKLKLETDQIHTMLVNIYLDQILAKSNENIEQTRAKLQAFLVTSNSYRVQSVLNRVNPISQLRREVALLSGKMNNFEQAFRILVDELQDFEYAENYCVSLSQGKSSGDRKIVAHVLFRVLLTSLKKYPNEITEALLRLLRNTEIEFDFIEVLQQLPSTWSLASLSQILVRALRTYSYTQRSKKLESSLVRLQNESLHVKLSQLKCAKTIINEHRQCKHCLQHFHESSCVVYEDGSQGHVHCAKKYNQNETKNNFN